MPAAEVDIDAGVLRRLLEAQYPDLADLALEEVAAGWDNVIIRIGDDLVARMPRRQVVADLVEHEHRWLPLLAPVLPLPIPSPVHAGRPGPDYPWSWSICRWLPGVPGLEATIDPATAAADLGAFVAALAQPAPPDAPLSPIRGVPLAARVEAFEDHLAVVAASTDTEAVRAAWNRALGAAPWSGSPRWLHGDLHPGNVLVHEGRLSGVIDFVDINGGDPATDLMSGWMWFDAATRLRFRDAAGVEDDATWERGRGWALAWAVAVMANSADNPVYNALGRRTLAAVLAD